MNFTDARQYFIDEFFKDGIRSLSNPADVRWAIEKAYADMTLRTIRGAGRVPNLKADCCTKAEELFDHFFQGGAPTTEDVFDKKHNEMCDEFLKCFNQYLADQGLAKQQYGKAQKIINMTFKYLYCFIDSEEKADYFQFCHMPLDSYILGWCARINIKGAGDCSWSSLDYGKYKKFCTEIRRHINSETALYHEDSSIQKGKTALECEFVIWQEEKRRTLLKNLDSILSACEKDKYFKRKLSEKEKKHIQSRFEKLTFGA